MIGVTEKYLYFSYSKKIYKAHSVILPMSKQTNMPHGHRYDALILDAHTNQSLVTIRSLGKKGMSVASIGNPGRKAPAFSSKWCSLALISPAHEGTTEYAEFLLSFLKKNTVGVIFSSSDGTVSLLQKYRKEISKYSKIALAKPKALATAINKEKTLTVAKKLGIKTPKSIRVANASDIKKALQHLSFPIVIKPVESWTANKKGTKRVAPELVMNKKEALRLFKELTEFGGETIFQEYLTGRREAVGVVYGNKTFFAMFAQLAKRTQPPLGGTSVLRQSIELPQDIKQHTQDLIREIDLEGYSLVEFRRNAQGVPYLMEINPRLTISVVLSYDAGLDFPYILYLWAKGAKVIPSSSYKVGVWERYMAGDLIHLVEALQQHGRPHIPSPHKVITDFIITSLRPMYYDYFDLFDIFPMWSATKDSIIRNVKKLL